MNTITTPVHALRKSLVIALAVMGMGGAALSVQAQTSVPAQAQVQAQPGSQGRHAQAATREQRQARHAEHAAKRTAKLHDSLKLSAAQEPAWATFIANSKPQMRGERHERGEWKALSAPARMEKRIAMAREHIAMMETRLTALNNFYAVLTPEQKKLFDENSAKGGMRGKGRGHHGGGHGNWGGHAGQGRG